MVSFLSHFILKTGMDVMKEWEYVKLYKPRMVRNRGEGADTLMAKTSGDREENLESPREKIRKPPVKTLSLG